jgi:hypothetical protein
MTKTFQRLLLVGAVAFATVPVFAGIASATVPAPAAPVIGTIISGNRSLAVNWTDATTGVKYVATATATNERTRSCHTNRLTCTIRSLNNGVAYNIIVTATNAGGSTPSSAVTATAGVPGAPLGIHVKLPAAGDANLSWNPPRASGVSGITGYTATATDGTNVFTCSTSRTATRAAARKCEITGLTSGTKYTASVTATNAEGTGAASKTVSFTAK